MSPDFPTAPPAYGLNGPSAAVTVEKSPHASHTEILTTPTVTTDYQVVMREKPDGSSATFNPPLRKIRFPVSVGDEWEDPIIIAYSDGKKSSGKLRTRIVGYEAVEVPAGSFMAYKAVTSSGGNTFFEGWYVPEARGFVKSVFRDNAGKMVTSVMTDYQRSDDPSGELASSAR